MVEPPRSQKTEKTQATSGGADESLAARYRAQCDEYRSAVQRLEDEAWSTRDKAYRDYLALQRENCDKSLELTRRADEAYRTYVRETQAANTTCDREAARVRADAAWTSYRSSSEAIAAERRAISDRLQSASSEYWKVTSGVQQSASAGALRQRYAQAVSTYTDGLQRLLASVDPKEADWSTLSSLQQSLATALYLQRNVCI